MDELLRPIPIKHKLLRQLLQKVACYRLDRCSISRMEYQKILELLQQLDRSLSCPIDTIVDGDERGALNILLELAALLSKIRRRSHLNYSIDEWLREHLQEIREYKINTYEYREAVERLLSLVPFLPGIYCIDHPYYRNAISKSLEAIEQNIRFWLKKPDAYIDKTPAEKLRKHFVNWSNRFLKRKVIDECYRKLNALPPLSLDRPFNEKEGKTCFLDEQPDPRSLDDPLEEIEQALLVVKRYIEIDPEGELRQFYTSGCPECNCQTILKEVYLNPEGSAAQLAVKLGIGSEQNIYSVWRRRGQPIINRVFDNYHQYLYVLKPVLSGWIKNFIDSTWHTVESILGSDNPNLPWVFRDIPVSGVTMCKEINLGMAVGYPLAFMVNVTPTDEEFSIVLRVCTTGEPKYLPPNLQIIVFDDKSGESFCGKRTIGDENWTEIKFTGMQGESFSVEITLGNAIGTEKMEFFI